MNTEFGLPENIRADWPEACQYPDWSQRVMRLPEDEQITALAILAVNGADHVLQALVAHRQLFKKLFTDDDFTERIRIRAFELARLASID
jgi:hypothetical protein